MSTTRVPEPREWVSTRRCVKCGETKPWANFAPKGRWPDGTVRTVQPCCHRCEAKRLATTQYPSRSPESMKEYRRRHRAKQRRIFSPLLPVEPFREWLLKRYEKLGSWSELAVVLGVDESSLRKAALATGSVSVGLVDRCLTAAGDHLNDLYPPEEAVS